MKIQALIEKYFEGETTLEEEARLRDYFGGGEVDETLREYQPLFAHFASEREQRLPEGFDERLMERLGESGARVSQMRPTWLRQLLRVAAVGLVLLAASLFLFRPSATSQQAGLDWSKYEVTDEQVAYDETVKALKLLSSKLNKGSRKATQEVEKMEKVGKYLN